MRRIAATLAVGAAALLVAACWETVFDFCTTVETEFELPKGVRCKATVRRWSSAGGERVIHGRCETWWDSEWLVSLEYYEDGDRHGPAWRFYSSGNVESVARLSDGGSTGTFVVWEPSGVPSSAGHYIDWDYFVGRCWWRVAGTDDDLAGRFMNGYLSGTVVVFRSDGSWDQALFDDGVLHGPVTTRSASGEILAQSYCGCIAEDYEILPENDPIVVNGECYLRKKKVFLDQGDGMLDPFGIYERRDNPPWAVVPGDADELSSLLRFRRNIRRLVAPKGRGEATSCRSQIEAATSSVLGPLETP